WDRIEDRKALDGYVRRAIVNTHISWWRRRRVDEYPTDEIPDKPVADTSGDTELHDTLQRAIDRLPQRMRAAVVLRYFEDMSEAEVADVLGVSPGTVKSTVSRAVAKLRTDTDLTAECGCGRPCCVRWPLGLAFSPGRRWWRRCRLKWSGCCRRRRTPCRRARPAPSRSRCRWPGRCTA